MKPVICLLTVAAATVIAPAALPGESIDEVAVLVEVVRRHDGDDAGCRGRVDGSHDEIASRIDLGLAQATD